MTDRMRDIQKEGQIEEKTDRKKDRHMEERIYRGKIYK